MKSLSLETPKEKKKPLQAVTYGQCGDGNEFIIPFSLIEQEDKLDS